MHVVAFSLRDIMTLWVAHFKPDAADRQNQSVHMKRNTAVTRGSARVSDYEAIFN